MVSTLLIAFAALINISCGSGGQSSNMPPVLSGNTSVTLLLSSAANGQLSDFRMTFNSLILTSKSGKTVNLLPGTQNVEFIHLNGSSEPLPAISIPQDIYTTATAKIGQAQFTCAAVKPTGGLVIATYAYGATPDDHVSVALPAPITVTGANMGLALDMLVSKSASLSACYNPNSSATYAITPTFNLTPVLFSSQPTNSQNGQEAGLQGKVVSLNSTDKTFTFFLVDGQTLKINTANNTVYQGINDFSGLGQNMLVDMDAAIQPNGMLLATRMSVADTDPTNLSVANGPLLTTYASEPALFSFGRQQQGFFSDTQRASLMQAYSWDNATFQISGQFTNLQNLPFVASFNAANMFGGQNVYISTHAQTIAGGFPYSPATTLTLMPQTVNGMITGVSTSGNFQVYSMALADYDLPPTLVTQPGISYTLNSPKLVEVYVDSSTRMLNTQALSAGNVLRFNGLLFNDAGTLRMVSRQVNDGVPE